MVLLLVTHVVEVPSSRVPLAVIILNDAIKRKSLPSNLKCRMVPEEFTYGLALELTTSRAADKVATSGKNTLDRLNTTGARVMETVVEKLDRLDQRTHLITATREATSAAVGKVKQATDRALESEGVQKSLASISNGLQTASKGVGRAFTWVGAKVKETFPVAPVHGAAYASFGSDGAVVSSPPAYEGMYGTESPLYAMPVSTNAARPSADDAGVLGASTAGGATWGTNAGSTPAEEMPMPHDCGAVEDELHVFEECPAYKSIRAKYGDLVLTGRSMRTTMTEAPPLALARKAYTSFLLFIARLDDGTSSPQRSPAQSRGDEVCGEPYEVDYFGQRDLRDRAWELHVQELIGLCSCARGSCQRAKRCSALWALGLFPPHVLWPYPGIWQGADRLYLMEPEGGCHSVVRCKARSIKQGAYSQWFNFSRSI
ncbi:hypothetical protein VOLCADRAFT_91950 [Volvox carteri f. nagariensis]|uniref:Uncharacterized protein n=1 Tax=Volvox carteri f. nagariensis TaxID=3068 RepID=D8TYD8_VOLCA|nr:uncharacterized protein VOLCADRAFT_91950 [Volvox carteri f. nagariensis]EFJ47537.1 hypothetical protein VOLCADRAFT_91950 [Volvox carteri f. nagariensis]|eukprot:XP_002951361.1 hypothetical protein VOLCADRAFT_91950 [Volvox carteri f. nagariensis]